MKKIDLKNEKVKELFDKYAPQGSKRRKLFYFVILPLIAFFILVSIANIFIMPVITRHGDEFPLPDFTNSRLLEADFQVKELNLAYEVSSEEYSPGKERGYILNQFPIAGTKVKEGRVIKFVVSLGQKNVPIPSLAGLSVRQAILDLETSGLLLGEIAWAFSDTLPEKVVVFSYPNAGIEIPLGTAVNLMVNRGRASNFTYMPIITGLTLDEAIKDLEDMNLKLGLVTYRTDENFLPETVLEQSEDEGTELDIGTEIDLVISTTQ